MRGFMLAVILPVFLSVLVNVVGLMEIRKETELLLDLKSAQGMYFRKVSELIKITKKQQKELLRLKKLLNQAALKDARNK